MEVKQLLFCESISGDNVILFHFVCVGSAHSSWSDQPLYDRCLPEIIGFCNKHFYDNRLIPLLENKLGFGRAIQFFPVKRGKCLDRNRLQNIPEAEEIVKRVRSVFDLRAIF